MNAPSLTNFMAMTKAKFQLFDLGLYLRELPSTILTDLDNGQPYSNPHLGYAWLAIFNWHANQPEQNSFWFLKLPLDEQGILPAGVHSDLVSRFYRAIETSDASERQRLLTEHPYQFTPDHEKMAALHAVTTCQLGLSPSHFFEPAHQFFINNDDTIDWQTLGIQGIADVVWRLTNSEFETLINRLPTLALPPLLALLQQFEHREIPVNIIKTIASIAQSAQTNDALFASCLRACAQSAAASTLEPVILARLKTQSVSTEVLLTILTRYSYLLKNDTQAVIILDSLATRVDSDAFARVITNLAMQPNMTGIIMKTLTSPTLTEALANALSNLIQQKRRAPHATH